MSALRSIDAELNKSGVQASLVRVDFSQAPAMKVITSDNIICMYLRASSFTGEFRCAELKMGNFAPAMPVRFRPKDIEFEWRCLSGKFSVLCYAFSHERICQALDEDFTWRASEIERGCDLTSSNIVPLMQCTLNEMINPGLASVTFSDSLSTLVIIELIRHLRNQALERPPEGRLALIDLRRIRERCEEDKAAPTVGELARLCGMGERNLLRLFKAATGETISGYVGRVQANRARNYLSTTHMPLKEVAFRLGFTHASSFVVAFRRATGETPGSYRRRLRA